MRPGYLLAAGLVSAVALAACGGGGGGSATSPSAAVIPAPTAAPTTAPLERATVPMAISIPRGKAPSGVRRSPKFVSPSIGAIAVYDGTTLIYVANVNLDDSNQFVTVYASSGSTTAAPGTCTFTSSKATCGLTLTSTVGPHKFDLIMYPSNQGTPSPTPPAFNGVISSEGELAVTLSPGANPAQTMTLLGVADKVIVAHASNGPYNQATTFGYRIEDSTNAQIVLPGSAFDNGPVTITAAPSGIVTIAPNAIATPPAAAGDQFFDVTCVNAAGGSVTISFNAQTKPNATYASGLTYTTANYSAATIATTPFTCDSSSATIPITVQGKRR